MLWQLSPTVYIGVDIFPVDSKYLIQQNLYINIINIYLLSLIVSNIICNI